MGIWLKFQSEVSSILKDHSLETNVILERPPKEISADLAFPCFSLAKILKKSPYEVANDIFSKSKPSGLISSIEASGPYVNFFANWEKIGPLLLKESLRPAFGKPKKTRERIMVEFAHPNTHKAFHIGHVRNIALGESVCRILEFSGSRVIRANYQGDIGPHVAKTIWGIQNLGLEVPKKEKGLWLGNIYSEASKRLEGNEDLEKQVREINKALYSGDKSLLSVWKKTRQWSLQYFEGIYRDFGVRFDRLYFESEVEKKGVRISESLVEKKIAKLSDGSIILDLNNHGLGIFVLVTRDKTPLYSAKDFALALLQEKEFHPSRIIHIVGSEQNLHFMQLFKSLEKINPLIAKKEFHMSYGLVTLSSGKMASRTGNVITYDDLKEEAVSRSLAVSKQHSDKNSFEPTSKKVSDLKLAENIGLGAIKYDMLRQSPEKNIVFDWNQALSLEGNSAPYLQYTFARASSIIRKAKPNTSLRTRKSEVVSTPEKASPLTHEKEIILLKRLAQFPEAIHTASRDLRPHYIANYAYELASEFNDFYQNVRVLDVPEKPARLALVRSVQHVLKTCLFLLGIDAPESM